MRGRGKLAIAAVGAVAAVGGATGAVFAAGGGQSDQAADLAAAINERAGTSITGADVTGAYEDVLKARLDAEVAAGRLTQAQADRILERAANAPLLGPLGGRGHETHGPRRDPRAGRDAAEAQRGRPAREAGGGRHARRGRQGPGSPAPTWSQPSSRRSARPTPT